MRWGERRGKGKRARRRGRERGSSCWREREPVWEREGARVGERGSPCGREREREREREVKKGITRNDVV